MKEKIKFMNNYTYIHRNNSNSTCKKIKRENGFISFKDLSENIIFTVNESEKRKYNKNNISFMLMEQMYEFYYRFIISDIDDLISWISLSSSNIFFISACFDIS